MLRLNQDQIQTNLRLRCSLTIVGQETPTCKNSHLYSKQQDKCLLLSLQTSILTKSRLQSKIISVQTLDFTDFDFEGSNFSVLIDTLAYNTYITAFNSNMVVNESFLRLCYSA